MPAPSDVLALINGLEDDKQEVVTKATAKTSADAAVTTANQQAATAASDLASSKAHLAADLQAAHAKLDALYGGDPTQVVATTTTSTTTTTAPPAGTGTPS